MSMTDLLGKLAGEQRSARVRVAITGVPPLDVVAYSITERVALPFEIDLKVRAPETELIDLGTWIGQPASCEVQVSGTFGPLGGRRWTGVVVNASRSRRELRGASTFRVSIQPELSLLQHRRNSRVHQLMSDVDVIEKVLAEWGIPARFEVDRAAYPARKYRVQHEESDFDFLQRLVEDLGVLYMFRPDEQGRSTFVLTDRPHAQEARQPPLLHVGRLGDAVATGDFVGDRRSSTRWRPPCSPSETAITAARPT
jgi:uncharacterized protein involved in type VI secretion and phage assembly